MSSHNSKGRAHDPIVYQACHASTVAPIVLAKYGEGDRGLAEIGKRETSTTSKRPIAAGVEVTRLP